ncbi:unnamed protein product [Ilex paraguariensis]|uniref:Uncharacterized protein n=1 Tax=Ilex paraguariensis TaxID=185542 RepID=A0ABC8R650_9AQUA
MVEPHGKQAFMINSSPLKEHEQEGIDIDHYEETVSPTGCCCFGLCSEWPRPRGQEGDNRYLLHQNGEHKDTWLVEKLKKAREVSEITAGPKWKNLIRKIGKDLKTKKPKTQFQYDPQSYALNFDQGFEEEEEGLVRGFPSKFAPPFSGELQRQSEL